MTEAVSKVTLAGQSDGLNLMRRFATGNNLESVQSGSPYVNRMKKSNGTVASFYPGFLRLDSERCAEGESQMCIRVLWL